MTPLRARLRRTAIAISTGTAIGVASYLGVDHFGPRECKAEGADIAVIGGVMSELSAAVVRSPVVASEDLTVLPLRADCFASTTSAALEIESSNPSSVTATVKAYFSHAGWAASESDGGVSSFLIMSKESPRGTVQAIIISGGPRVEVTVQVVYA